MSIIIRLQNLPWSANALDIRQFFTGLQIPEGGVHIVGGELGDAFIAFSTDEDARQAFLRTDGKIKGIQIKLMLSSRTEMQRVIEQARTQSMAAFMLPTTPAVQQVSTPLPAAVPQMIPAAVPEVPKGNSPKDDMSSSKRDRRRSRSKSRDKRDRSRDRRDSRRHRDRSRSKSRDRRERRRGGRDRSRNRDRKRRSRSDDKDVIIVSASKKVPEVWSNRAPSATQPGLNIIPPLAIAADASTSLLGSPWGIDPPHMQNNLLGFPSRNLNFQNPLNAEWSLDQRSTFRGNDEDVIPVAPLLSQPRRMDEDMSGRRIRPKRNSRFDDYHQDAPVNACVSLEPFYGPYGDIRRFFTGLSINYKGIKVINDEFGHKTGICYIQFRDTKIKNQALTLNGTVVNGTEVKVRHISDKTFHDAVDRYNPRMDDGGGIRDANISERHQALKDFVCLKLEDLPSFVKEQDILHIFSQHPLTSLHLNVKPKGGTVAYVKFSTTDVAKQALNEKSHHVIRGKAVTVKPCSLEEFNKENAEEPVKVLETDCLSISKLPVKISDRDISDFFSDIGVIPTKIHLISSNAGFTGLAYCEFESQEDAAKAATKDSTVLGQNTISVQLLLREDMEKILNSSLPHPGMGPGQTLAPGTPLPPIKGSLDKKLKVEINDEDDAQETKDNDEQRDNEEENMEFDNGQQLLGPFRYEGPPQGSFMGPQRFRGGFAMRRGGFRGGRFPHAGGPPRFPSRRPDSPTQDEDMPGCSVYLDNVPYKAGTNEILDFFNGYNCTNNVSRRYNPNNTPSAEAKVSFFNPDDAFRAVRELNGQKIWGRPIYLRQQ